MPPLPQALPPDYYYTSVHGNDVKRNDIEQRLWAIGFEPRVFKKQRDRKSKGVDISLTRDAMCHAFDDHFDLERRSVRKLDHFDRYDFGIDFTTRSVIGSALRPSARRSR